jgi:hypothetical protein
MKRQMHLLFQRGAWLGTQGLRWLRAWPWFAGSIVLGLTIKENFPFSHWPMYSNFTRQADYVYVVDGNGQPLATRSFAESAPRLRKQFERERRSQEKTLRNSAQVEEEAAIHLLKRLARRLSPEQRASLGGLGLVRADVQLNEEHKIVTSERTVAMLRFGGLPPAPASPDGAPSERLFER